MTAVLRVLPGLTALALSFLAAYLSATNLGLIFDAYSNPQFFFTVSHVGSALLCAAIPFAFVLIGRLTCCRADRLRQGSILLSLAALPMFIANAIYVFILRTPLGADGAIGPGLLLLLGMAALLVSGLVFAVVLPRTRPVDSVREDSKQAWIHE